MNMTTYTEIYRETRCNPDNTLFYTVIVNAPETYQFPYLLTIEEGETHGEKYDRRHTILAENDKAPAIRHAMKILDNAKFKENK